MVAELVSQCQTRTDLPGRVAAFTLLLEVVADSSEADRVGEILQ